MTWSPGGSDILSHLDPRPLAKAAGWGGKQWDSELGTLGLNPDFSAQIQILQSPQGSVSFVICKLRIINI